jgi:uncharacterized protein
MGLSKELQKIIVGPKCKGELEYEKDNNKLKCESCRLAYKIVDDIPVLLVDEAESL